MMIDSSASCNSISFPLGMHWDSQMLNCSQSWKTFSHMALRSLYPVQVPSRQPLYCKDKPILLRSLSWVEIGQLSWDRRRPFKWIYWDWDFMRFMQSRRQKYMTWRLGMPTVSRVLESLRTISWSYKLMTVWNQGPNLGANCHSASVKKSTRNLTSSSNLASLNKSTVQCARSLHLLPYQSHQAKYELMRTCAMCTRPTLWTSSDSNHWRNPPWNEWGRCVQQAGPDIELPPNRVTSSLQGDHNLCHTQTLIII